MSLLSSHSRPTARSYCIIGDWRDMVYSLGDTPPFVPAPSCLQSGDQELQISCTSTTEAANWRASIAHLLRGFSNDSSAYALFASSGILNSAHHFAYLEPSTWTCVANWNGLGLSWGNERGVQPGHCGGGGSGIERL